MTVTHKKYFEEQSKVVTGVATDAGEKIVRTGGTVIGSAAVLGGLSVASSRFFKAVPSSMYGRHIMILLHQNRSDEDVVRHEAWYATRLEYNFFILIKLRTTH